MRIKKIITVIAATTSITLSSWANESESSFYIKGSGIIGISHDIELLKANYKGGSLLGGNADLGFKISDNLSAEIGLDYIHSVVYRCPSKDTITIDFNNMVGFKVGMIYNYDFGNNLGLYTGLGGGNSWISIKKSSVKNLKFKNCIFGSADIGISYNFTESLSAIVGYNFKYYNYKQKIITHSARIGFQYSF